MTEHVTLLWTHQDGRIQRRCLCGWTSSLVPPKTAPRWRIDQQAQQHKENP